MIILGKMGLYFIDKKRLLNRMCKLYISQVMYLSKFGFFGQILYGLVSQYQYV